MSARDVIAAGNTSLGIEFGSTRIKAVLIGPDKSPLASGSHTWVSRQIDGVWTYSVLDIWSGLRSCHRTLAADVMERYGLALETVGSIGISAMMHGYMAFDKEKILLTPFRTWQNTFTAEASEKLTALFGVNIPQRWTIAHLYQAMLKGEEHLPKIDYLTTLAGYVHWRLTGFRSVGVGEGSGIFPLDPVTLQYDSKMMQDFCSLPEAQAQPWQLPDILPEVLPAGENAGWLTAEGARMLDSTGTLQPGIPFCPPEGDAETGMMATGCIAPRSGSVSAGTSIFSMAVLEHPLSKAHPEIDLVMTPDGKQVAMVHCNNCTNDLNTWAGIFTELAEGLGADASPDRLYTFLFQKAMEGDSDAGGLVNYNYLSGEPVTGFQEGRPLFARIPGARMSLANFLRAQLYSALAGLAIGNRLLDEEGVELDSICGHGGFFKTPEVGATMLASALGIPVTTVETAGEGGPWGMALLAAWLRENDGTETLPQWLQRTVFDHSPSVTCQPNGEMTEGFMRWLRRYEQGLGVMQSAVDAWKEEY